MKIANIKQTQADLEALIKAANRGEEVFIARRTTIVAQILPLQPVDCAPKRNSKAKTVINKEDKRGVRTKSRNRKRPR
jgi:antitoxin (DNA-binding transcriptional repressor) of toxin-antitoxin stability system